MELPVQTYLKSYTLKDLEKEHGVYARVSTKNPKKFSLNYDQIEVRSGDVLAEDCRGLVLEATCDVSCRSAPSPFCSAHQGFGPTRILAYPFKRFYNFGDPIAANIDWKTAKFFEKLDGTLCIVYWDPTLNEFFVATRSVPDADIPLETGKTFTDLFKQAAENVFGKNLHRSRFSIWLDKDKTYMFELTTPENEVVVKHRDYKIHLLGVRDNLSFKELDIKNYYDLYDGMICPSHSIFTEKVIQFVNSRNPLEHEGLVVCDANFNRVKLKNPDYVLFNKVRDRASKSPRALLEFILQGKEDDVRAMLPSEFQERLDILKVNLGAWCSQTQNEFDGIWDENRKTFAITVQSKELPIGPMMYVWSKKGNFKDWILSHKNKDGSFPNQFLDIILKYINL